MLLPDETYEQGGFVAVLRTYDDFLAKNHIRPDFFCQYRDKMVLLQKLILAKKRVLKEISAAPDNRLASDHSSTDDRSTSEGGISDEDASSPNEADHLHQRLRSLSCELTTLRNRLHVTNTQSGNHNVPNQISSPTKPLLVSPPLATNGFSKSSSALPSAKSVISQPAVPPRSTISTGDLTTPRTSARNLQHKTAHISANNHANTVSVPVIVHAAPTQNSIDVACDLKTNGHTNHATTAPTTNNIDDLIHLPATFTEDAVVDVLHTRFNHKQYYTNVGPILLCVNPYLDVGNPLTLSSTRGLAASAQLNRVVQEAVRQQTETGYPQAIILSGTSGSGKTHASMLLLRQLFAVAGGGPETDAFKHLAAAFTVLRSLGSAKTNSNSESSRIGQFIEVQVTDGALYRTKIHCYFLDQTRVTHPLPGEKNYHIFYQMLAGLSSDERTKLCLEGYNLRNLSYLQRGDTVQDTIEDANRFQAWKSCLGVLGIPFLDVVRVLAAILLLGNIQIVDGKSPTVQVEIRAGEQELNSAASLLGVSGSALFKGLTSRSHTTRGQVVRTICDAAASTMTRDNLAKALYCRTVATIVRRANSLKRLGSTLGTLSSDSNESVHNHHLQNLDIASQHASTVTSGGGAGTAGAKSMAALNNAVRHATDGFIGILDMFGFEDPRPTQLEHLCINLCAETMQHFYNTHIFKSSIESCRDEGIQCELDVDYVDNVPCIDLISSLRTGLLSMLDTECSIRGTPKSYVAKVRVQHKQNPRLFEPSRSESSTTFGIHHFYGKVVYDASNFLDTNKDVISDDLISVFHKHTCNFGFATHLFGSELKALYSGENTPRGVSFRISPTSHTDLVNGNEPVSTLTQDFHTRLDNLLRTLVHARPHFVRCIRSNTSETPNKFDAETTMMQIRSLQVLETVNLMGGGFPHRMRFKIFYNRYKLISPHLIKNRTEEKIVEECQLILRHTCEQTEKQNTVAVTNWAIGKRHVFLSENLRQSLERLRTYIRHNSATLIQATWRGWKVRKRIRREHLKPGLNANRNNNRPRPQPIAGTPPPEQAVEQTCNLFGLDLERPPPVPPSRSYTVTGNTKLGYPQTRIMKMSFPEDEPAVLMKGESVLVIGASHKRGHLVVEHKRCTLHVPFQFLELNHPSCAK